MDYVHLVLESRLYHYYSVEHKASPSVRAPENSGRQMMERFLRFACIKVSDHVQWKGTFKELSQNAKFVQ